MPLNFEKKNDKISEKKVLFEDPEITCQGLKREINFKFYFLCPSI